MQRRLMFCHKLMWHQTAMTIKGCLILIWSCLEGFCEPTALHKLTRLPVFYGETINVFFSPSFSRLMSKGKKGDSCVEAETSAGGATRCSYPPTTNREKNKESGPNGSLMNNKTPLMFWCSRMIRIWIYWRFSFFPFSWLIIEIIGRFCHRNN